MAFNYARLAETARRMIDENGRDVVLVKVNREPADPNMPWRGSDMLKDTETTVKAVFADPVSEKELGRSLRRGDEEGVDNITRGSQMAFIAAEGAVDETGAQVDVTTYDRMLDRGLVYTMKEISELSPGSSKILYLVKVVR